MARVVKIIDHSCKIWGVPRPNVIRRAAKKTKYSYYNSKNREIGLIPDHMNMPMALHEVAHHIAEIRFGTAYEPHGQNWLGIFVDLLVDWKVAPREAIEASLRFKKLKFTDVKTTPKQKGR